MNELALFAGAGGGILGGHLLGWRTVCAVEWEPYAAGVLCARQNDGLLPPFPVWDDVRTFDGRPWRGRVDVISGGFPCQDISAAGGGLALTAPAAACGAKWPESSVKYCRASSSWKTHRCLWEEALPWSSVTLPRWGMTVDGLVLQHPTLERPISATDSGSLRIPTPTRTDYKGSRTPESLAAAGRDERNNLRDFCRARFGWKLPMPAASENLMGWPEGWTDLKPLAMDKFREWQQQHGGF